MPSNSSAATMTKIAVAIVLISCASPSVTAAPSHNAPPAAATYSKTSFVPPAAPSIASPSKSSKTNAWSSWSPISSNPSNLQNQIITGYGTYPAQRVGRSSGAPSVLYAKKKGGASGQPVSKKGKIQVQLTQTVPNIGQSGDIIFVSSAIFQNQLKKNNAARLISEEEVQKIEQEKAEKEEEVLEMARKTKGLLEVAMLEKLGEEEQCGNDADICGVALDLTRKAGPEGNLFGGVTPKMIMDALKERYPDGAWDGKQVKVTEMKDLDGADVPKMDIKHVGEYKVTVSLGKEVDTVFLLSIKAE